LHTLAPALTLTLSLIYSLNHLANKLLRTTTTLYGLTNVYSIMNVRWIIVTGNRSKPGELSNSLFKKAPTVPQCVSKF